MPEDPLQEIRLSIEVREDAWSRQEGEVSIIQAGKENDP